MRDDSDGFEMDDMVFHRLLLLSLFQLNALSNL